MVKGIDIFKKHFADHTDKFILIGGTACDLSISKSGQDFRATKDLDIVLLIEAVDVVFTKVFWDFIKLGKYNNLQKNTGKKLFYRFYDPQEKDYPFMLELFARRPDILAEDPAIQLAKIHISEDATSLSAILIDEEYYELIINNKKEVEGLPILSPESIIPLKAKAFLDLSERKENGEAVDDKDIRKHKNDVFRIFMILSPETRIKLSDKIANDMLSFIKVLETEPTDLKNLGIKNIKIDAFINNIKLVFNLKQE